MVWEWESGAVRGEVREDADLEVAAAVFLSSLTGMLLSVELFGGKRVEPIDEERLVRETSNVILRGIIKQ